MKRDRIDALKEKANLRIEDVLDSLGLDYRERYNYVVAPCPIHGGDRRDALSWHLDRGIWKCFSRGCEELTGSDIFGLIRGIRDCTFMQAVKYLEGLLGNQLDPAEIKRLKDLRENREFIQANKRKAEQNRTYPRSVLDRLKRHTYLESRGYPEWVVDKYHIGACLEPGRYMSNRIVVPVTNLKGELVGFTGRTFDPDYVSKRIPKWKHSLGSWVSVNLFNIDNAAPHIQSSGAVILCEGPLDVLRLEQAGIHNGVAILGKKFYPQQMTILAGVGATRIIDALDNDAAGQSGSRGVLKTASYLFDIERANVPAGCKDVGEMSIGQIRESFCEFKKEEATLRS
jgi:DNA primase